ncbi:hypothetical protein Micbo1qcDRAFT_39786 [Microdochium bolleyi]|uniref:Beta-lactamase-like protein n=1 Tax=Microdochium bolleyi TaxID=196109 RepID=A0A136J9N7_9PEZI|nr:hypothetical protein Micbo1qcDRAFT_39786 [Microdochium bolleyi]
MPIIAKNLKAARLLVASTTPRLPQRFLNSNPVRLALYSLPVIAAGLLLLPSSSTPRTLLSTSASTVSMSSKLIPSSPDDVMVIRHVTPNVVTCSVPFSRFGMVRVGGRGTIIKMTNGSLAVFSPVALTPAVKTKILELSGGPGSAPKLAYIIAGDIEHHIFLSEWAREYPAAKVIGPEGLPEKRSKVTNDDKITPIDFAAVLSDANHDGKGALDAEFLADFEVEYVGSHANKEVVLCYKPDRVLIEADLFFNLPAIEQYSRVPDADKAGHGLVNRFFQMFQGTEGDAKGNKRFQWYVLSAGNRDKYSESVRRIYNWDFDAVIPCHGETIDKGGKAVFAKVFEWHLEGHK